MRLDFTTNHARKRFSQNAQSREPNEALYFYYYYLNGSKPARVCVSIALPSSLRLGREEIKTLICCCYWVNKISRVKKSLPTSIYLVQPLKSSLVIIFFVNYRFSSRNFITDDTSILQNVHDFPDKTFLFEIPFQLYNLFSSVPIFFSRVFMLRILRQRTFYDRS